MWLNRARFGRGIEHGATRLFQGLKKGDNACSVSRFVPANHRHRLDCADQGWRAAKALETDGPRAAFDGAALSLDDVVQVLRLLHVDRQASKVAHELSRKTENYDFADSETT